MFSVKSPQNYLQRPGLLAQAGELIRPLARHLRILTSPRAWQAVNPPLIHSLEQAGIRWETEYLQGECTEQAVANFRDNIKQQGADGILAVGGGQVLDTTKAANQALGDRRLITIPTLAATCAAWSPLAIIYNSRGGHLSSNEQIGRAQD